MQELMKRDKMFQFEEINHFYDPNYFGNNDTRRAWYIFCFKFLSCVNGEWLRSINPSNARNKINMFRYITVSDEAFTRWVLEVKYPKLLQEQKDGWPATSGGKKPNGMHDSRQYSQRYAEIHCQVKQFRSSKAAEDWNNLFWSIYRVIHPTYFADIGSDVSNSAHGTCKIQYPEEDDYDPESDKTAETKVFSFQAEENIDQMMALTDII
jgi:hypothetical protein